LEFENEYVRVIRCRIPGRDKVKMPQSSIWVGRHIHDGPKSSSNSETATPKKPITKPDTSCGQRFQARHMGENITDQLYEYLRVDIKAALPKRA